MSFYDEITENKNAEGAQSVETTENTLPATEESTPLPPEAASDENEAKPEEPTTSEPEQRGEEPAPIEDDPSAKEPAPEQSPAPEQAPAPTESKKADEPKEVPAEAPKKTYKTGTKIAAFVFFLITAGIFAIYEYLSFTLLYLPLVESIDNFGEAIAAIFGYIFGLIYTIVFAIAQLPANIISIILFKRIRGKSDKKWENALFTVFFALSIVMLLVTILSTVLFLGASALGG